MKNRLSRNLLSVKIILPSLLLLVNLNKLVVVEGDVSKYKKDKRGLNLCEENAQSPNKSPRKINNTGC